MNTDFKEDLIRHIDGKLLELLLADRSTKRNIVWATDNYREYGELYSPECEITSDLITGAFSKVIRPRVTKPKEEQSSRTRSKAEVFTPSWICNQQNNLVDEQWFGYTHAFNAANGKTWKVRSGKIEFTNKSWQDYVCAKRMEITCGEAPYLVSRYDTVTNILITDAGERIGLLDRKLRIVNENTNNETDWLIWVKKAYQSIYGYEYQGDNLLLARENLLFTFIDNMLYKFDRKPTAKELYQIAYIISWNIWQMDGLKYTAPYSETKCEKYAVPCVIRDWTGKYVEFQNLLKEKSDTMTFDAIVGNPPYQIMDGGAGASAKPVYNLFAQYTEALSPKYVSMIIPARWYSGGKGLDAFRKMMLNDKHLRQLHDFVNSNDCFVGVEIKGGICYFLWDSEYSGNCLISTHENNAISFVLERPLLEKDSDTFIRDNQAIEILRKVRTLAEPSFSSIVHSAMTFGFRTFFKTFDSASWIAGTTKMYANHSQGYIFTNKIKKGNEYIGKWKVYIPEAIGSGDTKTDVINPILGEPNSIATETYIMNGPYESEEEAKNAVAYINTKFFHFMLGLKKFTQHTTQKVYQFIPIQDFTNNSDINWHSERFEVDKQLYKKYKFSSSEISYIENSVQGPRKKR